MHQSDARTSSGHRACRITTGLLQIHADRNAQVCPRAHRPLPHGLQAALHGCEGRCTPMALAEAQQVFAANRPHLHCRTSRKRGASSTMRPQDAVKSTSRSSFNNLLKPRLASPTLNCEVQLSVRCVQTRMSSGSTTLVQGLELRRCVPGATSRHSCRLAAVLIEHLALLPTGLAPCHVYANSAAKSDCQGLHTPSDAAEKVTPELS